MATNYNSLYKMEFEPNDCPYRDKWSTLFIWEGLYKAINDYLSSITLQDIVERHQEKETEEYIPI